ncbi:MAG: N-acetylmuramoyl-L-alanine amidase [Candidatus Eremiobacteraeota bacterium]|nr:N-acetylmuramoyl-L-alanine amidase [Candidatus Eremiobacteraeota bacterium]
MRWAVTLLAVVAMHLSVRVAVQAAALSGDTFVVDPGHGTRDPHGAPLNVGAVGAGGVQEQAVVLAVGEDLATLLRTAGARVVLTRSYAHPFRTATDRAKDNRARAALANALHATAFIAVHADSSVDPATRGASVFWLRDNSIALARAVRRRLDQLGLGESQFHARHLAVTDEARVPAVLVEVGFVSNAEQARTLASTPFQHRLASALFAAIADAFER